MPAGRPKFETNITDEQIVQLARIGCSYSEIAAVLGCHKNTVERNYSDIIKEGHEHLKASLKRMQFQAAMKGNVTMLIWLGKQFLGQSDKQDVSGMNVSQLVYQIEAKGLLSPKDKEVLNARTASDTR